MKNSRRQGFRSWSWRFILTAGVIISYLTLTGEAIHCQYATHTHEEHHSSSSHDHHATHCIMSTHCAAAAMHSAVCVQCSPLRLFARLGGDNPIAHESGGIIVPSSRAPPSVSFTV
ncbi:MAG TPA: hypothetical protein VFH55_06360 [Nitrospiria bacterium]|nr:hypothetical protein [Nitrospiria bacterium]